jgi:hypothetical protein
MWERAESIWRLPQSYIWLSLRARTDPRQNLPQQSASFCPETRPYPASKVHDTHSIFQPLKSLRPPPAPSSVQGTHAVANFAYWVKCCGALHPLSLLIPNYATLLTGSHSFLANTAHNPFQLLIRPRPPHQPHTQCTLPS